MELAFLSVEEVATILQVSNRTVRNMINRGRFPDAYKIDPMATRSTWRIPTHNLNRLLETQQNRGTTNQTLRQQF